MTAVITKDVARITSSILHPYLFLSVVVGMIAYQNSPVLALWAKWTIVTLLTAYLLPVIYMRLRIYTLSHTTGVQSDLHHFFRERPLEMAVLACIFGIPSTALIYYLNYPSSIIATIVAVAVTTLVIALTNLVYRASFHLALFSSATVPLMITFGLPALTVLPFMFLLGTARYYLGEHTPLQLTAGFFIGVVVTAAVFYGFGILK